MPEVEITKTTTITVERVGENDFGDLTFTDTGGGKYKISKARRQYFDEIVVSGKTLQLSWSKYKGVEYVYSAVEVKQPIAPQSPKTPQGDGSKPVTGSSDSESTDNLMTKEDWEGKERRTRKSIERQSALSEAVKLVIANIIALTELIPLAKRFEAYLAGNMAMVQNDIKEVQPAQNKVVEEARKLGATEIKKGETVTDPRD